MKKKLLSLMLVSLLALSMIACGKDDSSEDLTDEEIEALNNLAASSDEETDELYTEEDSENEDDPNKEYPRDSRWDTVDVPVMCMQIGDVFIYPLMTAEELDQELQNSDCDWDYEYNPEVTVEHGGKCGGFNIKLAGDDSVICFTTFVNEMSEEVDTQRQADCVLFYCNTQESMVDKYNKLLRFYDGSTYEELQANFTTSMAESAFSNETNANLEKDIQNEYSAYTWSFESPITSSTDKCVADSLTMRVCCEFKFDSEGKLSRFGHIAANYGIDGLPYGWTY